MEQSDTGIDVVVFKTMEQSDGGVVVVVWQRYGARTEWYGKKVSEVTWGYFSKTSVMTVCLTVP